LDWTDVHEKSGALQNAINLIESAHRQNIKVVIDFPIAVTSIHHDWFQRSAQASLQENTAFSTYFFWKRNLQPNEFVSYFNATENLYYHVEEHPEWPVLNYGAPNVTREIKVNNI
jgi:glycosidase